MTGCVQKGATADTFVVSNTDKGPKMIGIVESKDNLAPHVGHKVTITGAKVGAEQAAKIEGEKSATGEALERHLKVTGMKNVAATCP